MSDRNDSHRRQAGFTLLELLAAVTLLAIGFFIVLSAMGNASSSLLKDDNNTQMALTARSVFDAYSRGIVHIGQQNGDEAGTKWQLTTRLLRRSGSVNIIHLELTLERQGHTEHFSSLRAQGNLQSLEP